MLRLTHWLFVVAYLIAPIVAMAVMMLRRSPARRRTSRIAMTLMLAILFGTALPLSCAFAAGGRVSGPQIALCVYLTASLLILLSAVDALLVVMLRRLWLLSSGKGPGRGKRATAWRRSVELFPFFIRAGALIVLAVPYLMSVALTYRPKIVAMEDPANQLGYRFQTVRFETSDGFTIRGWWIPARSASTSVLAAVPTQAPRGQHRFGRDTVIVCHGIGANKASALNLARALVPQGYNVLMFDFRGHGESDGQLTTLGDLERRDVLAAIHWVRIAHENESRRVLGLGVSTGAAALIGAAADDSDEGRAIDAVAVIEGFDDLATLGHTIARTRFLPPLSWVADRVGLMFASAQTGTDLMHFSPADAVKRLWPRPILVIHGGDDALIPFERGEALFDAASEPKRRLWLTGDDYGQAIHSRSATREVRDFFDEARSVPAI